MEHPYEWISKLNIDSIKRRWKRSLAGNGFCPICHRTKDKHTLASCPLLAELNLKLIRVTPPIAGPPVAVPAPAASPSPGGCSAAADEASALGSVGSANAPSGLVATVAEEYDSDDTFCWDCDESGVEFSVSSVLPKSNNDVAFYYPSCNHVVVEALPPPLAHLPFPSTLPVASSSTLINLSKHLSSIIEQMAAASLSLILALPTTCFLTSPPSSLTSLW
jgi:hypothetical protein